MFKETAGVEATNRIEENCAAPSRFLVVALLVFCGWALFFNLGGAALFEPDEGRNAEIAREILLLKDWVTPHYDFIPRLDKPISYYWLIALSYKIFGVSEWSARLPSALAALGCLAVVYGFTRLLFGPWAALWSVLVLLSSVEFIVISRIVILDMVFTFFLTCALCCFATAARERERDKRKLLFLLMYAACGAATLVKGPIGFLLPGAIVFFYLLLSRRWHLLREIQLVPGVAIFLAVVAPWYVAAEVRNPGYLRYFLLYENVARFATAKLDRHEAWYFFLIVLCGGFFPWTLLLPNAVIRLCRRPVQHEHLFLLLWAAVPLIVFSLSSSKLPHYILPIFPALAVVVGSAVDALLQGTDGRSRLPAAVPLAGFFLTALGTSVGLLFPQLLPQRFQTYIDQAFPIISLLRISLVFLVLGLGIIALRLRQRYWRTQIWLCGATAASFALVILLAVPIMMATSFHRSSKDLAEAAAPFIGDHDQLVLYGGYPSSLPFYLRIQRPIAVVLSQRQRTVLGSNYVASQRPRPVSGYGEILLSEEEFATLWQSSPHRLVVFTERGGLNRLRRAGVEPSAPLLQVGEAILLENKPMGGIGAKNPRNETD
jgi:4-amino-4-deoxy-L-arabinose transferase-like glycosyltransferase